MIWHFTHVLVKEFPICFVNVEFILCELSEVVWVGIIGSLVTRKSLFSPPSQFLLKLKLQSLANKAIHIRQSKRQEGWT